jgi:hypothetical protein
LQRIPKQYGDTYWKGTPNPIILRLPNDFEEEIFWEESNGEILFQKNWKKIAKHLNHGYLLTFKYIGGSHFKVKIFGPKGLELLNYPSIESVNEDFVEATKKGKDIIEVTDESEDDEIPMQAQRTRNGKRKGKDISIR